MQRNEKNIHNKRTVTERCFTAVLWQFWQVFLLNGFNTNGLNEPRTSDEELPRPPSGSLHILSHHTPHPILARLLYFYSSPLRTQNYVLCVIATKTKKQNSVVEK